MKDYLVKEKWVEINMENGKQYKVDRKWVDKTMKTLETDIEDVLLMWLEDNEYLINDEQEELDKQAKGKVKIVATNEEKAKKKTPKERVQKENPTKELIIQTLAKALETIDTKDITIENKTKIITFSMNNEQFKIDLTQKRKEKSKIEWKNSIFLLKFSNNCYFNTLFTVKMCKLSQNNVKSVKINKILHVNWHVKRAAGVRCGPPFLLYHTFQYLSIEKWKIFYFYFFLKGWLIF